ncbi:MAG: 1-deoxy-D-xylulose-5-phosphate synthase [Candidatus Melainabacteria bacterium]|nr:1-deoxy-D-xylulose-5-phosphate synthase [Candidatus Melainabacteria bacterium]
MQTLAKSKSEPSFLDAITGPGEVKKLKPAQLVELAREIRQEIIFNLNKTGGHLASNLGVVEITLALHHVFETPKDCILWDVGHQAYIHKMLTGRRNKFSTLRQYQGLSGFISPQESEHDAFVAGHSSTSVSLAVGMAIAKDHLKEQRKIIALIGDGGLTGGMALEALNHLGHIQKNVLIILNDNDMSISENVGGYSQYMKRIKETYFYKDIKKKIDWIEDKLDMVPLDPKLMNLITSVKQVAKDKLENPGIVFEKLGINYSGPIDGHDVEAVINALNKVKDLEAPHILHLITRKGKGFTPAEEDSIKYHGVKAHSLEPTLKEKIEAKDPDSNINKGLTYSHVFTDALIECAELEPNMVAITPATAEGSGLVKFGKAYPDRFFDVAICEQHAVTMAAGMAKMGLKPVVSIYSTFLQRALDQVIHDVAIMNLPVIFGIDRGGLVEDGETHQGQFDLAFLRSIPNFTVLAPKDAIELRQMVYSALRNLNGPVAIRFPREKAEDNYLENGIACDFKEIDYKSWQVLKQGKSNKVILACGAMIAPALQAANELDAKINDGVTVINARSIKPLDTKMLQALANEYKDNLHLLTIEEGTSSGGFGSAVLEWASECEYRVRVSVMGLPDRFIQHGDRNLLLQEVGLTTKAIIEKVSKT